MAILNNLIVNGAARFLNKTYFDTISADKIDANEGIFKKLVAKDASLTNATIVGLLDVQGDMHTNSWSNSNIATIDGNFYITPTAVSADGADVTASGYTPTGTITYSSTNYTQMTITGTFDTSQLTLDGTSAIAWPANSYVIVTGDVLVGTEWYPLGTIRGKLSAQVAANTSSKTFTIIPIGTQIISGEVGNVSLTDGNGYKPSTLEAIRTAGATLNSLKLRKVKISMTSRGNGNDQYALGIYMTAMGGNKKTFLDIYGGNNKNGVDITSTIGGTTYQSGAFAKPTVRIGNLLGLPAVGGITPTGWGIYTSNGFFSGTIAATQGKIGSGTKIWTIGSVDTTNDKRSYIYSGVNNISSITTEGIYVGTDGILNVSSSGTVGRPYVKITNGVITAQGAIINGTLTAGSGSQIGPWHIIDSAIYKGNSTQGTAGQGNMYFGDDGLSISNAFTVTNAGVLNATGATITGNITATSLTISSNASVSGSIPQANITNLSSDLSNIKAQTIEYIIGTQTGTTNVWTGVTTDSALVAGKTIAYYLPYAGNSSAATLNLTLSGGGTTGAKNVQINNSNVTTHYPQYSIIKMTYDGTYWKTDNYNSDTWENRVNYLGAKTGSKGIWAGSFFMEDGNGTYQNICTASDGTVTSGNRTAATSKIANTNGFKVNSPIWYTNTNYAANTNISGSGVIYCNTNLVDSRYGFNTATFSTAASATGCTVYQPLYLVGTINSTDNLFYLDSTWWTQSATNTSKVYILFGAVFDVTGSGSTYYYRVVLYEKNPWYVYDGTRLVEFNKASSDAAAKTATSYITDIDTKKGITVKPYDSSGNDYLQMNSTAIEFYRNNTSVMNLTDSAFRIGTASGKHSTVDSNGLNIWIGAESTASNKVASFGSTITLYKPGTTTAAVTITDSSATFTGVVNADTGRIGGTSGWTIASQQISSGSIGSDGSMFLATKNLAGTVAGQTLTTTAPSWRFTVGSNFGVTNTGGLYASGATLTNLTIKDTTGIRVKVDTNGLTVYDGSGTADANIQAKFGSTIQVGKKAVGYITIASNGIDMYASSSNVNIVHLGYDDTKNDTSIVKGKYFKFSSPRHEDPYAYNSNNTYRTGEEVYYNNKIYRCIVTQTTGNWNSNNWREVTNGFDSFNIGYNTCASDRNSFAGGDATSALGPESFAFGNSCVAAGFNDFATGFKTLAKGSSSCAFGSWTVSSGTDQMAIGYWNVQDTTQDAYGYPDNIFIIGNGSSESNRSNAFIVNKSGNVKAKGRFYASSNSDSSGGSVVFDAGHTIDTNSTCLPQFSGKPSYLVGIEAFASGGTMKWQSTGSIRVGYADNLVLPGAITMYAGSTAPTGWLLCDGSAVSRTTYSELYAVIGTTYGSGNGSSTFNLPDLRGRTPIGAGTGSGLTARTLGTQNIGSENAIIPYHRHSVSAVSGGITGGSHNHDMRRTQSATATSGSNRYFASGSVESGFTTSSETHTHNLPAHDTNYAGTSGNTTGANMQPSAVVNFIICTGKTS